MSEHATDEDVGQFKVVVNDEEQYSISPNTMKNPPGWRDAGKIGSKAECREYVKTVWADMRPPSLRRHVTDGSGPSGRYEGDGPRTGRADARRASVSGRARCRSRTAPGEDRPVVQRGDRPRFRAHSLYADARRPELGFQLDHEASNFDTADFDNGIGIVHVEGLLTLDSVKVRCVADIDLRRLSGQGRLVEILTP